MTYTISGKYRGTSGKISISGGNILITRLEGLISKTDRIVAKIPVTAIDNMSVEGLMKKKLIVLVDNTVVRGIPRHEFDVPDPYKLQEEIQNEIDAQGEREAKAKAPAKEVYVREVTSVVKVPCSFCGALNEVTEKKCSGCGANIGGK